TLPEIIPQLRNYLRRYHGRDIAPKEGRLPHARTSIGCTLQSRGDKSPPGPVGTLPPRLRRRRPYRSQIASSLPHASECFSAGWGLRHRPHLWSSIRLGPERPGEWRLYLANARPHGTARATPSPPRRTASRAATAPSFDRRIGTCLGLPRSLS